MPTPPSPPPHPTPPQRPLLLALDGREEPEKRAGQPGPHLLLIGPPLQRGGWWLAEHCKGEAGRLLTQPTLAIPTGGSSPLAASFAKVLGTHRHLVSLGSALGQYCVRQVVLGLAHSPTLLRAHLPRGLRALSPIPPLPRCGCTECV